VHTTQNRFWNRIKAEWYRKGLEHSNMADRVLSVVLPRTRGMETFLDVGAGCGTLSIPLAKAGKKVTALDPSPHMVRILREDIKREGIEGIRVVNAAWGEVELEPHDVIICANVPELLKDSTEFLSEANEMARKMVFLIVGVGPLADKFYYRELFPLVFKKEFLPRSDYLKTYTRLHELGIYANVEIIEYDFDQPFDDMNEALAFWKEYMGLVTEEHDERLRDFLNKKLERTAEGGLLARFHKKSAVVWWKKQGRGAGPTS